MTDDDRVQEINLRSLAERFGSTESWWNRHRPQLVRHGILNKRGRKFFGKPGDVARWLAGWNADGGSRGKELKVALKAVD